MQMFMPLRNNDDTEHRFEIQTTSARMVVIYMASHIPSFFVYYSKTELTVPEGQNVGYPRCWASSLATPRRSRMGIRIA